MILSTIIWFSVNVPVLSDAMIDVAPKVSTAESVLTKAWCLAIVCIPFDKVMVWTAGIASGIAATARITAICKISLGGLPLNKPIATTKAAATKATIIRALPNWSTSLSNGVCWSFSPDIISEMRPTSVFIPVPVTTTCALPRVTAVPEKTIFNRSPIDSSSS